MVNANFKSQQLLERSSAQVSSLIDYYTFGMWYAELVEVLMHGRQFNSEDYRYGFNGMEKDDEVKGAGNSYDFGSRLYDSRLGRWLSEDPKVEKFPGQSSYAFASNSPNVFIDPDGKENILYLIFLPGSEEYIKKGDQQKIANWINQQLAEYGFKGKIEAVVFDESKKGEFKPFAMDATDNFAFIGEPQ